MFYFAAFVFFATYILIASEKVHKTTAALLGSSLMLLIVLNGPSHEQNESSAMSLKQNFEHIVSFKSSHPEIHEAVENHERYQTLDVYARYVNFDVIFTLAGMMLLVNVLSGTGIFQYIAIRCTKIARGDPVRTMILMVVATAVLSAFLDNVTTVLLIAPVTLLVADRLKIAPLPFLMAETLASNIGGAATLIGDPPNLIIGSMAHLNFMAFIIHLAPFIVLIVAGHCLFLKLHYSRKMTVTLEDRAAIMELDEKAAITDHANLKRGGFVMLVTIIGFLLHGLVGLQPCIIAMSGAALALLVCKIDVDYALEKIEWSTLFFFLGLFILVNGAEKAGLMQEFGKLLSFTSNWNVLATVILVMWVSGIAAALMNNVSFTAAMVTIVAAFLHSSPAFKGNIEYQHLMWWGLALAVCLGGNGTVVGAAANLVTAGIAEKSGHPISFKEFMHYGLPMTAVCLVASTIYISIKYWYIIYV